MFLGHKLAYFPSSLLWLAKSFPLCQVWLKIPSLQISISRILLPYFIIKLISPSVCNLELVFASFKKGKKTNLVVWHPSMPCVLLAINAFVSCIRWQSSLQAKSISHLLFFSPLWIALSRYSFTSKVLAKKIGTKMKELQQRWEILATNVKSGFVD